MGVGQGHARREGVESEGSLADDNGEMSMQCAVCELNSARGHNIHAHEKGKEHRQHIKSPPCCRNLCVIIP